MKIVETLHQSLAMTSSSEGKFDLQIAKIFQKLFSEGVSEEQKMRDGHDS